MERTHNMSSTIKLHSNNRDGGQADSTYSTGYNGGNSNTHSILSINGGQANSLYPPPTILINTTDMNIIN